MPEITYLPFDSSFISLSEEREAKRSPGMHLTGILRDMRITAGVEKAYKQMPEADQHMMFEQGFLWERLVKEYIDSPENKQTEWDHFVKSGLVQLTEDALIASNGDLSRPGECMLDGVAMTPDAVNLRLWHVEEWKATSVRKKNFSIKLHRPQWIPQIAAYCKFFHMNRGVLRIWHYGEMPTPEPTQMVIQWSDEELDANWDQILTHYEHMKKRDGEVVGG